MALLYTLPLGESILEQFIDELQGEKNALLILPNRYQMEKVQFSNVQCTGIDTLANRILNENGCAEFEQINRRTQELVVEELISMMMEAGNFSYFAKLVDKEGFLKSMTSFIGDLARTGLTTDVIIEHFKLWQEDTKRTSLQRVKDSEVLTLYAAYCNYLDKKKWYDLEGKYRLAVDLLEKEGTKIPWQKLRVFGFYSLDKLQVDLLRELSKRVDLSIAMYYGTGSAYAACRQTYNSLMGFCIEKKYRGAQETCPGFVLSQNIFENISISQSSSLSTNGISLVKLTSRDKEICYAFTEIKKLLQKGVDVKDIVLVVRKLDNFSGLGAIADEYKLPISLGKSCKLANHSIFNFVKLLYMATSETHMGAENYFKLLSDPFISIFWSDLPKLCLALKEKCYFTSFSQARHKVKEALQEKNTCLKTTNDFISAMGKHSSIKDFVISLQAYLKKFSFRENLGRAYQAGKISIDGLKSSFEALKALDNCLDLILEDYKLCGREYEIVHPLKWLDILNDAASELSINLAHGRTDGVRIMEATNMQGLNYKYVYLLGLRRDEFPVAKNESWVYNDVERDGLHMDLETTYASYDEDAYFFAATLASAQKQICITYYEEEAGEKSSYVDDLQRIFLNKIEDKFVSNLHIINADEKEIASSGELWEKYGLSLPNSIVEKYADHNSVQLAENCSDLSELPHYHGQLVDEKLLGSMKQIAGSVFSASGLREYLNCPYAFLLNHILKLGDGEFKEEDGTPADKGSIIHDTLSGFINNHLNKKLDIDDLRNLYDELDEIFDKAWQVAIDKGTVMNTEFWQAEKPSIRTILHNWLVDEISNQQVWSYRPIATETEFFGGKTEPTIKLKLTDGSPVELCGAIDRVDSDGETLFVTDYKLSTNSVPSAKSILNGEDLQMDVYMLAAKNLYKKPIAGGGYYALSGLSRKRSLLFAENNLIKKDKHTSSFETFEDFESTATGFIVKLIENIYAANFMPLGKKCDYCPYMDICRKKEVVFAKEECDNA